MKTEHLVGGCILIALVFWMLGYYQGQNEAVIRYQGQDTWTVVEIHDSSLDSTDRKHDYMLQHNDTGHRIILTEPFYRRSYLRTGDELKLRPHRTTPRTLLGQ